MMQVVISVDLSVDVGDNTSVLDTINLTFIYDNISDTKKTSRSPRDHQVSISLTRGWLTVSLPSSWPEHSASDFETVPPFGNFWPVKLFLNKDMVISEDYDIYAQIEISSG